jgi:hypothetical protein
MGAAWRTRRFVKKEAQTFGGAAIPDYLNDLRRAERYHERIAGECSQNSALERLDFIGDNKASEQRNTVQPQAVNLAYAEPCLDSGTAFFIAGTFAILDFGFWIGKFLYTGGFEWRR